MVSVKCQVPDGQVEAVERAWTRYLKANRFAFATSAKCGATRVESVSKVVSGITDMPASVQADTLLVTNEKLSGARIGSPSRIPLSPTSVVPVAGGFVFPLPDKSGDHIPVELRALDPNYDPAGVPDGWLLVHRPGGGEIVIEYGVAPCDSARTASPCPPPQASAASLPEATGATTASAALSSITWFHLCVHHPAERGRVVPDDDASGSMLMWECHPNCPMRGDCDHEGCVTAPVVSFYRPVCPSCGRPLQAKGKTDSGVETDWSCANGGCPRSDEVLAVFSNEGHLWTMVDKRAC